MDDQLYDEFGNYIGPDLEDEDEDLELEEEEQQVHGFETTPVREEKEEEAAEEGADREPRAEESALMQIDGIPISRNPCVLTTLEVDA